MQETKNQDPANASEQERIDALVCQITDGFLHGSEQRDARDTRPFEELLANLLPRAGVFARSVVSQKLSRRADLPRRIIELMLEDDAAVAEPLAVHCKLLSEDDVTRLINRRDPILRQAIFKRDNLTLLQRQSLLLDMPVRVKQIQPKTLQVAAQAAVLPLSHEAGETIGRIESTTAPVQAAEAAIIPEAPVITQAQRAQAQPPSKLLSNLVRAAVLRRHEDLATLIAAEADLSAFITQALLKDASGEALMAVCHHIGVPEDAAVQIATLLYPPLSRTREQLTTLRQLYRSFTAQATARIISAWRALPQSQAQHQGVHAGEAAAASPAPARPQNQQTSEKISA